MQLLGFNNLTKTLGYNSYNIAYTPTVGHRAAWQDYIARRYSCERLTQILSEVAAMIDAKILNIARQTYEPQGASVTMLVAEQPAPPIASQPVESDKKGNSSNAHESITPRVHVSRCANLHSKIIGKSGVEQNHHSGLRPDHLVMHLDKSHLTVHTYPESDAVSKISTVRVDIDVSTCGRISPLTTLNYLIRSLESDIVTADYRVRGFARDVGGRKHFIDHKINSIQNFMSPDILCRYNTEDVNLCRESIFHTRMVLKAIDIKNYLFGACVADYNAAALQQIKQSVLEEMTEIFHGSGDQAGLS